MPTKHDLAIIRSGGGTFTATIRANALGKLVVMIECGMLGGICMSMGCVPSKALTAVADARHAAVDVATRFPGIAATTDPIDMLALIARRQALVGSLRGEKYVDVAGSYGQQILRGDASFVGIPDAPALDVAESDGSIETTKAHHYLVATDSRPWVPPINGLEETGRLTLTTVMELTGVPEPSLVLGSGYVVLGQAQLFARLGPQVTLLVWFRFASKEEPEMSKTLQGVLTDEGIRVVSRAVPTRVPRDTGDKAVVTAALSGGSQELRADQALIALGCRPVTGGLNLDAVGVDTGDSGEVVVSDRLQSSNLWVWAVGDVTGYPEFVYVTTHHDTLIAENAFVDTGQSVDYTCLPQMTFIGPVIGTVGMTEKSALAAEIRCDCRVLPLHHVPCALVNRDIRRFIRVVVNAKTKEIFGLTAVARDVGELATVGIRVLGRIVAEVANAWTSYLTMAEGIWITAKVFTTDPPLLSCCT